MNQEKTMIAFEVDKSVNLDISLQLSESMSILQQILKNETWGMTCEQQNMKYETQ